MNIFLRTLLSAVIISACLNSAFIVEQWMGPRPDLGSLFLLLPLVLLALLSIPIALLCGIFRRIRKPAMLVLLFSLSYVVTSVACVRLSDHVRMQAFHALAAQSTPLVEAITQFTEQKGHPPETLQNLVPKYLVKIPGTGMKAYPEYEYLVGEDARRYEDNPWILKVSTPLGGINFDMFIYFPKGNYPEYAYGSQLERIGDWAYCHE